MNSNMLINYVNINTRAMSILIEYRRTRIVVEQNILKF